MPASDRRKEILDYAAPLFAEKGISGCTVRGIAEGVGILSGSLYHYFDSKDAIVEAIVVEYLQAMIRRYDEVVLPQPDPRARLHDLVLVSLEVAYAHPHASQIYQGSRGYFEERERFATVRELATAVHGAWSDVIRSGVEAGAFRADVNQRVFHRFLRDSVFLASRWFRSTEVYRLEDLADDTTRIFLDGFVAPRSGESATNARGAGRGRGTRAARRTSGAAPRG